IRRVALNGIDVKIIIPGKGDRGISFNGSNAYVESMIDAGAKVYSYDDESFIHAKIMIVDSEDAAVGTANFDVRSFILYHDLMVYLYNYSQAIHHFVKDFNHDINDNKLFTKVDMR